MRRPILLIAVGGVIGAVAILLMRRASASNGEPMPAPASAPVHMAVGVSAPELPITREVDDAVS
jgi:hypothetical protein